MSGQPGRSANRRLFVGAFLRRELLCPCGLLTWYTGCSPPRTRLLPCALGSWNPLQVDSRRLADMPPSGRLARSLPMGWLPAVANHRPPDNSRCPRGLDSAASGRGETGSGPNGVDGFGASAIEFPVGRNRDRVRGHLARSLNTEFKKKKTRMPTNRLPETRSQAREPGRRRPEFSCRLVGGGGCRFDRIRLPDTKSAIRQIEDCLPGVHAVGVERPAHR